MKQSLKIADDFTVTVTITLDTALRLQFLQKQTFRKPVLFPSLDIREEMGCYNSLINMCDVLNFKILIFSI
jgi:hypothetical protein